MTSRAVRPYVCARCALALLGKNSTRPTINSPRKGYTTKSDDRQSDDRQSDDRQSATTAESNNESTDAAASSPGGAMTQRLEEATEDVLLTGGKAGQRAIADAGFSEELKEKLLARVKDAQFRSEYAAAFAEAGLPASAGSGTRATAASQPWMGEEATEDAVLRMLTDAHKPLKPELRGRPKLPELRPMDMRMRPQAKVSPGHRVANARDKASVYADLAMRESSGEFTEKEKEARRAVLRDRFQPGARAMPNTLTGLASLANERIEDAIARGQFKNIPRGKGVERDARSDNPFIDTTEYIMNKMIKRQDIVPPWIEKQQEVVKTAHTFRTRLRNDWKRHAARIIASKGGPLEAQVERAKQYARAEAIYNPRKHNVDQMTIPTSATDDVVMVKIRQQPQMNTQNTEEELAKTEHRTIDSEASLPAPFRDPDWLKIEKAYMELSIENLNTLTRSYNLMAPELAKKPYFSLERELNNCYADVAPQLADAIRERATRPSRLTHEANGTRPGSILDRFANSGPAAKVYDSKAPYYGFKEMWRDLFNWRKSR